MQDKAKPYISDNENTLEFTISSVIWGILFSIIFCVANAYLGLRSGLTISAGIPISILSVGIYKSLNKKNFVLECNMIQSIGGVGESLDQGLIFSLPALFMWAKENNIALPSINYVFLLPVIGGLLGIFFMLPLRKSLIVDEHKNLPYPEAIACAEVLVAADQGKSKSKPAFIGMFLGTVYKFCCDGLKIFSAQINYAFRFFKGAGLGLDASPALLSVGFIIGKKISCYMAAGGILGWCVIMPLIYKFGRTSELVIYPATNKIINLSLQELWGNYVRYIGAGAVATGGIFSVIKSVPVIIKTFRTAMKNFKIRNKASIKRTERDLSLNLVIDGILIILILLSVFNILPVKWFGSLFILFFGFLFATVASKIVGMVGTSNCPISGMTIATLLIVSSIFKAFNIIDAEGIRVVFYIGIIVCVISAISGFTAQTLKTGFLVGATPKNQEIGIILGLIASACVIVPVLYILDKVFIFGSGDLPAPQASLMKLVVNGVMSGKISWDLVLSGVTITIIIEILGLPAMSFALGLFLPINSTLAIAVGGFLRFFFEKLLGLESNFREKKECSILFASGLIAGEGLVGILIAVLAILKIDIAISKNKFLFNDFASLVFFSILCTMFFVFALYNKSSGCNRKKIN